MVSSSDIKFLYTVVMQFSSSTVLIYICRPLQVGSFQTARFYVHTFMFSVYEMNRLPFISRNPSRSAKSSVAFGMSRFQRCISMKLRKVYFVYAVLILSMLPLFCPCCPYASLKQFEAHLFLQPADSDTFTSDDDMEHLWYYRHQERKCQHNNNQTVLQ